MIHASTKSRLAEFDARAIGQRIRAARMSRKWTQAQLAEALGLAAKTIACWECGARTPQTRMLPRLAMHMRRSLDHLILGRARNDRRWTPLSGPDGAPSLDSGAPPAV